jgi:hypothetical protein
MHKDDRNFLGVVGLNEIKTFALPIMHRVDQGRVLEQPRVWIIRQRSTEIGCQRPRSLREWKAIAPCGIIQSKGDVHGCARCRFLKIGDRRHRRGDPHFWEKPFARLLGLVDAHKDAAEPFGIDHTAQGFLLLHGGWREDLAEKSRIPNRLLAVFGSEAHAIARVGAFDRAYDIPPAGSCGAQEDSKFGRLTCCKSGAPDLSPCPASPHSKTHELQRAAIRFSCPLRVAFVVIPLNSSLQRRSARREGLSFPALRNHSREAGRTAQAAKRSAWILQAKRQADIKTWCACQHLLAEGGSTELGSAGSVSLARNGMAPTRPRHTGGAMRCH